MKMSTQIIKLEIIRRQNELPYLQGTYRDNSTCVWGSVKTDKGAKAMLARWAKQYGLVVIGETATYRDDVEIREVESSPFIPTYSKWRHGGWYVTNIAYASGAWGCVSNNYPDHKWRIVCGQPHEQTYPTRDAAAQAEYLIAEQSKVKA